MEHLLPSQGPSIVSGGHCNATVPMSSHRNPCTVTLLTSFLYIQPKKIHEAAEVKSYRFLEVES